MAMLRSTSEMKDSGTRYLSEVPINWKVNKLKRYLRREEPKNPGNVPVLSLYRELGIVLKDSRDDNHNVTSENTSNYKYVQVGDFVVNKMKAWQGSVAVSEYEGIVSPAYYVYHFMNNAFNRRYFHYLLRGAYKEEFMSLSGGIRIGQWDLPSDALDNVLVLVPPLSEQQAIANYLDNQCSKIDEIITEATASIEEYKELKQAVILEAVTKGLDTKTPLRYTGNEWFPVLPVNVPLSRVRRHYSIVLGKMLCLNKRNDDDTLEPYFCAANIHFDGISGELKEMWFNVTEKDSYAVHKDDLLIVEGGAGAGGAAIVVDEPKQSTYIQNSVMIVRSKESNDNRYLCYVIQALVKNKYVDFVCNKATIPHFTKEKVSCIPYPARNRWERTMIADYLDERTAQMDNLISEKQALIDDLQAYKKSLIYEVVTGKRRVV